MRIKKKLMLKIVVISVLVLAIAFSVYHFAQSRSTKEAAGSFAEVTVQKRNISVTVSGTGTVSQSYRQDITTKVSETVKKVNYKEGDKVEAGDLLFELDDTGITKQIERTRLSIQQARSELSRVEKEISGLSAVAPISGQITGLKVKEGDSINKGAEVCTITNTSTLKLILPFSKIQAGRFYIGQKAEVYLQDYMQVVEGKVSYIDRIGRVVDGGGTACDVEILVANPGTIIAGTRASAVIGSETSLDSSVMECLQTKVVRAESGGTIKNISVRENQYVNKGQIMISIENDELADRLLASEIKLKDLNAQLESQIKEQDDYKIFAPGSGTILKQEVKVGDVVKQGEVISTIADNGRMEFEIPIDELDIAKISEGQRASVTIDALPETRFSGMVTKVSSEGTSQNGVTTYPVTIKIEEPERIKAGMNANAEVMVEQKRGVLTLPLSVVRKVGGQTFVLMRGKAEDNGERTGEQNRGGNSRMQTMLGDLGPDVTFKRIDVGISNDSDIEIVSGLNEGDVVLMTVSQSTGSSGGTNQNTATFRGSPVPGGTGGGSFYRIRTGGGGRGDN